MAAAGEADVFAMIGEEGFERLTAAFYAQIPTDDLLGPMYPADDIEAARLRLRDFLVGRFGGPQRYIEQRGHPRLRIRHAPFEITPAAATRWLTLMIAAVEQASLPAEARQILVPFFEQSAGFLINRPFPD